MKRKTIATVIFILTIMTAVSAQQHTENKADQILHSTGRVNPSTLAVEIDIPITAYPGRGISLPISLSYSSKVWRLKDTGDGYTSQGGSFVSNAEFKFGENTLGGWTSSINVPYIEYQGDGELYGSLGKPIGLNEQEPLGTQSKCWIKRISIHLPGGAIHELRIDDSCYSFYTVPSSVESNWNGIYYAVDGSQLKYEEDTITGKHRLWMLDGSFYDFGASQNATDVIPKRFRKAEIYSDRHGNSVFISNGVWTDTLGRMLTNPLPNALPTSPTVQNFQLPGYGQPFKLHWKKLKDATAAESALTDFSEILQPAGLGGCDGQPPYQNALFPFDGNGVSVCEYGGIFNPVLLAAIELPNGLKYEFGYNKFGEINQIKYPAGGIEKFTYGQIRTLSNINSPYNETNRGVVSREVRENTNASPLNWTYSVSTSGDYVVTVNNPDGTRSEQKLKNSWDSYQVKYGFDTVLAGMPYEIKVYSSANQLLGKTTKNWETSQHIFGALNNITAERHPRVADETTVIYEPGFTDGLSQKTVFEYDGDLSAFDTPLNVKRTKIYSYAIEGSGQGSLLKTIETDFLKTSTDPNLSTLKTDCANLNISSAAIAGRIKDFADTIISEIKTAYDEPNYAPPGRCMPTATKVWDSTKGAVTNSSAYLTTRNKSDVYGNVIETTDAKGNITKTDYDTVYHAFPIQVTSAVPDPTGQNGSNTAFITTATFDPVTGLPLTTTDANGLESRIEYDPATLRVKNTKTFYNNQQVGSEAETIYHDETGNYWIKNRAQIDTNKWAESITYFDGLGRAYKAEEINSEGNIFVEKEFDAEGRVKRVTNPFRSGETKQWTTNVYDEASRIKEVVMPDGAKVKTDYGVSTSGIIGITKQITDQAGKKRKGISDALGRMIRVIEDPDNSNLLTDYVFDTLGNLRKTIQGEQSRYFTYDSLGRLLYAKQPEQEANTSFSFTDPITNNFQWSVRYEYDDNGNITKTTDARNVSVTGTYDKLNRLTFRDYSDTTADVTFYYDGRGLPSIPAFSKGKMTRVASSVSETRYTSFDNLGRLLSSEQRTPFADTETPETTTPKVSTYQYNLSGVLIAETYPSGRTVSYNLDENGDLESVWGQKPNTSAKLYLNQIKYNSAGAIERMRLGNGRWETAVYNSRQQITQIGLGYSDTDKSMLKLDYDYGDNTQNNGSLIQQKINYRGLTSEIKQDYIYDNLNRLKSSTETVGSQVSWKQTFNYDRYGNRVFDSANTTTINQTVSWKITNPLINTSDNRLKKDQDGDTVTDYDYDKAGNVILDAENQRFVFDAENRMKEFFHSANTSNTPDAVYSYDGEGRRVRKVSGNRQTIFVYNSSGTLVAEYDSQLSTNPQVSYLTADHLGSPRVITDGRGAVIARHDYMAFGQDITETIGNVGGRTTAQGFNSADEVRKKYTGYERDDESGLDYAQARYYNSTHGRFTSVDPLTASASIRNPQTFNRYSYALNSPYKFTDPLGLIVCCTQADIDKQIEKDWGVTKDEYGRKFYLDNESLEKIKEKLRPYYNKAASLGSEAQRQVNEAAEKPPRVSKETIKETKPGTVTQTTTTINGEHQEGASVGMNGSTEIKAGTNTIESTDSISSSGEAEAAATVGFTTSIIVTESEPTIETTKEVVPDESVAKAAENMTNSKNQIQTLADQAAASINGINVTGTYFKTDKTSVSAGIHRKKVKVNSLDIKPDLLNVFKAGQDSQKPSN